MSSLLQQRRFLILNPLSLPLPPPGLDPYNGLDSQAIALDYRCVGFRECASEVARYLVSAEGLDIQDPLRLRLMSHLQVKSVFIRISICLYLFLFSLCLFVRLSL